MQEVAIQDVLVNVSEELCALSLRLQDVEKLLFESDKVTDLGGHVHEMQDIDLIIQQIADLGRAIRCVSEVELEGLSVRSRVLGDRLHLNDLRQRLLGASEQAVLEASSTSKDILFF